MEEYSQAFGKTAVFKWESSVVTLNQWRCSVSKNLQTFVYSPNPLGPPSGNAVLSPPNTKYFADGIAWTRIAEWFHTGAISYPTTSGSHHSPVIVSKWKTLSNWYSVFQPP